MNLDDLSVIKELDKQNMLAEIDNLPDQLAQAWTLGQTLPLPAIMGITRVVVSGMGGSAIGADLLAGYAAQNCPVPVIVHRDYGLPAFANGKQTLFIASSILGEPEETLDSFEQALKQGCSIIVVTTGGKLAERAATAGCPVWLFSHTSQTRVSIGFAFGLLLAIFERLGLLPAQAELLAGAVQTMKIQQKLIQVSVPAAQNQAKRYAGQLVGRWVTIFGSGVLTTVARRWKSQINELAKAPANFEFLPEADHNTLAGIVNPSTDLLMPHTMTLFLSAVSEHTRNRLRAMITRQTFMLEGLNTDIYLALGETSLAQMWTAIHFGDYMAFYLAIAYSTNPTPVDALVELNAALAAKR